IDLPVAARLALDPEPEPEDQAGEPGPDPIGWLAAAAGEADPERWWERMVAQRTSAEGVFAAISEAMPRLRQAAPGPGQREEHRRRCRRHVADAGGAAAPR